MLVEPGTEYMHILPVEPCQILEWHVNGLFISEVKVLVGYGLRSHMRINFNSDIITYEPYLNESDYEKYQNSDMLIFYCKSDSTDSPHEAYRYFKWLRRKHPESKQYVCILHGGINRLYNYINYNSNYYNYKNILKSK